MGSAEKKYILWIFNISCTLKEIKTCLLREIKMMCNMWTT